MIYNTFENVKSEFEYVQKYAENATKYAERYITDVLREVGTIELTIDNKPTILTFKGKPWTDDEHIAIYQNISKKKELREFSLEERLAICYEIRKQRLVEEYGDNKEEESNNESA